MRILAFVFAWIGIMAGAVNPVFQGWYADPEAVIYGDTYWIFPTRSLPYERQVALDAFSSRDLVNWERHTAIIDTTAVKWAKRCLWAPASIEHNGQYYLFFGANDVHEGETGGIGVAVADRPEGPYKDLLGKPLINDIVNGAQPIDQFVFKDDDGTLYMYYGGWGHCNVVRLSDDMKSLVPLADGSMYREVTPPGYVEGSVMFKRDGKYYFMWSEGGWTGPDYCVAYAIADSPMGPFKPLGKILKRDEKVGTGAGHHSVIRIPGTDDYYIVYHRHPIGATDGNNRVTCIDRMEFDAEGHILPVKMTYEGVGPRLLSAVGIAPGDMLTEQLVRPLGVNTVTPRFSWKNRNIVRQTAYEIEVASDSMTLVRNRKADLWRSGRVESGQVSHVAYRGKSLSPRAQAWWRVRVWDENGRQSPWSGIERFGIGITDGASMPLQGKYIGMDTVGDRDPRSPILRHSLKLDRIDGRVMAHVNSLGYHELYVNGEKAGDNVLSPGVSQLGKRSLIVTYDITPLVSEGDNDIALWLGQGWYKSNTYHAEYAGPVAKIEIDAVNGNRSRLLLAGDESWKAAESGRHDTGTWYPLQFGGERVDGQVSPADMKKTTLDRLEWSAVATPAVTAHAATPEMWGGNSIVRRSHPVSITLMPDGSYLADMGRVLTGWFSIELGMLPRGSEVTMEYADNMGADGSLEFQESDIYVSGGRPGERFVNKFNHHAYRYVKIGGLNYRPGPQSMEALQIHGAMPDASGFECSDADLNAVHDMIRYTMQCLTFSGYMVDCPHLERTGYGGDGNSSTMTLQTMYDVGPVFTNWLQAWGDVMDEDGSLPHVAPAGGGGGGPYWCGFIVQAPYRTWYNYGDSEMIARYYPLMKRWMSYVDAYSRDGLLRRWPDTHNRMWYLGDWLAPWGVDAGNEKSVDLVNNCFVSDCLAKMTVMARHLGLDDEAAEWNRRREAMNAAIHYNFYDFGTGLYATGSQLDMSYPLLVGATPEHLRDQVEERLVKLIHERDHDHIGAGLVGVPIVTRWAIESGRSDVMAAMLRQHDYPGYLHMIDNGATATWEYWSGERSRVHNCYNGVGTWFYQGLGGLVPETPGYERMIIDPQPVDGVDWVVVTKETPRGTAGVRWERVPDGLMYTVDVPEGSVARVKVPAGMRCDEGAGYVEVGPGRKSFLMINY